MAEVPDLADGTDVAQELRRDKAVSRWENEGGGLTHDQARDPVRSQTGTTR